jgi:hypothetical protein
MDKVEGFKWHLVAKTQGKGDPMLDDELSRLPPEDRARAEALAHRWLGDKVDSPASAGQPTPQARTSSPAAPYLMPQGGVPGIPQAPPPPTAAKR